MSSDDGKTTDISLSHTRCNDIDVGDISRHFQLPTHL